MLVQDWLRENNGNFNKLKDELGISSNFHSEDNRVILNYSQIDSPKTNPIVKECRGLVLDKTDYSLIARSFPRFYNYGETDEYKQFHWRSAESYSKEDGSLILSYFYNGRWRTNTRNSFGDGKPNGCDYTWSQLFVMAATFHGYNWDQNLTYIYELCTPYNQVVRRYEVPQLYLLSVFNGPYELNSSNVDEVAKESKLERPKKYNLNSIEDTRELIEAVSLFDKTFEGIVAQDKNGLRIKIKSLNYIYLHKLKNNNNLFLKKNLLPIVLSNEIDEIIAYFPEYKYEILNLKDKVDSLIDEIESFYEQYIDITDQKEFAIAVKNYKLSSVLFEAKKRNCRPKTLLIEFQKSFLALL